MAITSFSPIKMKRLIISNSAVAWTMFDLFYTIISMIFLPYQNKAVRIIGAEQQPTHDLTSKSHMTLKSHRVKISLRCTSSSRIKLKRL